MKTLWVLVICLSMRHLTLLNPSISLISQDIGPYSVVCVPLFRQLIDSPEDTRGNVTVKGMLVVQVDGGEAGLCASNMGVHPRDQLVLPTLFSDGWGDGVGHEEHGVLTLDAKVVYAA